MNFSWAFGTVILDPSLSHVMLKRQRNDWGGMGWTFPKGHWEHGETPKQTAIRETLEEIGIVPNIIRPLAGTYFGFSTINKYFIAIEAQLPRSRHLWRLPMLGAHISPETSDIRWANWDEAKALISRSANKWSRKRDLLVLKRTRMQSRDLYNRCAS